MLLSLLACLAVGAGGWNYARNGADDENAFRPYKSYSQEDLEALISAYDAEIEALQERYTAANSSRTTAANRAFMEGRVREFERVQRTGRATRELGARLAERQVTAKLLREEEGRRGPDEGRFALVLRRLFTIRL